MDKLILLLITGLAMVYIGRHLYHSLKHNNDEGCGCHGCGGCDSCANYSSGHRSQVPDADAIDTTHNPVTPLKPG
jgi:hypothetical protein